MKFSVLLPTRNRLELLRYAIESVRRQADDDWEIVVSDNASEEDIEGYVRSLGDPRIRYVRTTAFVPVTENWTNALRHSTGDYVVMLGDDDCLLKGFFRRMRAIIGKFGEPDLVYTNALLYAYPGVLPGHRDGALETYGHAPFFKRGREPFVLDPAVARDLARQSMNFKMLFTYNMQHSVISRRLIDALAPQGPFFQSPYPDFYATNVAFLTARKTVINPVPSVAIGISPKSFGFYYFNDQEKKGVEFLKNLPDAETTRRLAHVILPGAADRTAWLVAMETVNTNYGGRFALSVGYDRYRYLQILHVWGRWIAGWRRRDPRLPAYRAELDELAGKLTGRERLYLRALRVTSLLATIIPRGLRRSLAKRATAFIGKTPQLKLRVPTVRHENILEVFERVDPDALP